MITLQQTAGNNNQTIWCLRLRGEGSNLVANGTFVNSDGWTATGDWAIGSGVATYTYVDDATGALYRTLSAAEAVSYILEYEVTNVSGPFWTLGASDLTVNGGGTYFFASSVKLDATLGRHSVQLLGNAGGTELRFTITDVAALDTISIDNIKIRKADNIVYLSTKDITLDNTYDGQVLNYKNYLSDITYPSSIIGGGGTGSVTSFSFSISRHVSNSNFNSFFNGLYPATDAGFYVSRIVDFGVCWEGATTDTEITWLLRGRIIDYNYEQRRLTFTSFQESELTNREVPYYAIQKDFDNEVSYYVNAPSENYGITIPIIYGSFNIFNPVPNTSTGASVGIALTPAYLVDPSKLEYIVCSHQCSEISWNQHGKTGGTNLLFKYLTGLDTYMICFKSGDSTNSYSNTVVKYSFQFMYDIGLIHGDLYIRLKQVSSYSTTNEVANAIDISPTTFSQINRFELEDNLLALNIEGSENTGNVGYFKSDPNSILVVFAIKLEDDSTGNYRIGERNNTLQTPANDDTGTVSMSGSTVTEKTSDLSGVTSIKKDAILPWSIEELSDLEYYIVNYGADTVGKKINVYYAYLKIVNITVTGSKLSGKGYIKTPSIGGTGSKVFIRGGFRR